MTVEGIPNAHYNSPTDFPAPQNLKMLIFRADNRLFLYGLFFIFQNSILHNYFLYVYHNYSVFRDVAECSGMFHVPDFNDRPSRDDHNLLISTGSCRAFWVKNWGELAPVSIVTNTRGKNGVGLFLLFARSSYREK